MKPLKRKFTSKSHSTKKFKKNVRKTKAVNVVAPMRGGIRM
jgi:hypothetical protein